MDSDDPLPATRPRPRSVPERTAGFLALLVPVILGVLAAAGVATQAPALVPFVLLGFPLVFLGAEDALATGPVPWALLWAAVAGAVWWFAGRWAARTAGNSAAGFTWRRWGRVLAVAALIVLGWQVALGIAVAAFMRAVG